MAQGKTPKEGKITAQLELKNIGIDGKILMLIDDQLPAVREKNFQIGEVVEYTQLFQGPEKGKISSIDRKKAGKQVESTAQQKQPEESPAPPGATSTPHGTVDITVRYLRHTPREIVVEDEKGVQITYLADVGLIFYLARKDTAVRLGDKVTLQLVDAGGTWVAKSIGPDTMSVTFKTGKEILQENINAMKIPITTSAATPAEVPVKQIADQATVDKMDAYTRIMTEKCEKCTHLISVSPDPRDGRKCLGNDRLADPNCKNFKDKETAREAQQALPVSQHTDTVQKMPQNEPVNDSPAEKEGGIARIVRETKERMAARDVAELPVVVQQSAPSVYNIDQVNLIKATVARDATNTEFQLFMYLAAQYNLDPLRRQIWLIKYGENPASIFTGRDGFLQIAHRSGQFSGMESGTKYVTETTGDGKQIQVLYGWCKVYRTDMDQPFYVEVDFREYEQPVGRSGKPGNWQTKPKTMITKVAESQCLRKAFAVSGLYSPEEMPEQSGVT